MACYPVIARIQVPHCGFPSRPRGLPCTRSVEASLWHVRTSFNDLQPSNSSKGQVPAIAMFASFSRYKREAFRHSQFAPKALNDAGIPVIMKVSHARHKCPTGRLIFCRAIIPESYLAGCSTRLSKPITTAFPRLLRSLPSSLPPHRHWDWTIGLDSSRQVSHLCGLVSIITDTGAPGYDAGESNWASVRVV